MLKYDYVYIIKDFVSSLLQNPNFKNVYGALITVPYWQILEVKYYKKYSRKDLRALSDERNLCTNSKCSHNHCLEEIFLWAPENIRSHKIGFMNLPQFGRLAFNEEVFCLMDRDKTPYIQIPSALVKYMPLADTIKNEEKEKEYIARSRACMFCEDNDVYVRLKNDKYSNKLYCPVSQGHIFDVDFKNGYVNCVDRGKIYRINTANKELEFYDQGRGKFVILGRVPLIDMANVKSKLNLVPFL
jgi:hypothetical protein